jgi:hypothetical protein
MAAITGLQVAQYKTEFHTNDRVGGRLPEARCGGLGRQEVSAETASIRCAPH